MGVTRSHDELQALGYDHLLQQFARNGAFAPGGALELPVLVSGEGACRVTDTRGVEHLDALSGMFCMQLGYDHGEEIAEAAAEQLRTMPYTTNWSTATPTAIELATELARRAPGDISHAFFCGGGSEEPCGRVGLRGASTSLVGGGAGGRGYRAISVLFAYRASAS